jgi:hypothetical protein
MSDTQTKTIIIKTSFKKKEYDVELTTENGFPDSVSLWNGGSIVIIKPNDLELVIELLTDALRKVKDARTGNTAKTDV